MLDAVQAACAWRIGNSRIRNGFLALFHKRKW
jgi:hypothetical protein